MTNNSESHGNSFLQDEQEKPIRLYLARFESIESRLKLSGVPEPPEPLTIVLQGEMVIALSTGIDAEPMIEDIRRVALWSDPLEKLNGQLSLAGPANEWKFTPGSEGGTEPFAMRIYYPLLGDLEPALKESDAVYPQLEILQGQLSWNLENMSETDLVLTVTIDLKKLDDAPLGIVEQVTFGPAILSFQPMADGAVEGPKRNSLSPCNSASSPCISTPSAATATNTHEHRSLSIRFVSISTQPTSTTDALEALAQTLICGACEVWWTTAGVLINPQPNIVTASFQNGIVDSAHETGEIGIGIDKTLNLGNDAIDIYLVDQLTAWDGGGVTHICGTTDAYVILEINKAKFNKYLLAHELGHVLGLMHPDGSVNEGFWPSSYCSVMVPDKPNSHRNTLENMSVIDQNKPNTANPTAQMFVSLGSQGGYIDPYAAQVFFHTIRDFQYDDGTEDSVPQDPASVWWTHSDVWNSTSPTAEINEDHSPKSYDVLYLGTNYMFVRLHAYQPLTQVVKVYLYLTMPGSTTSALTLLTPISEPGTALTNPIEFSNYSAPIPSEPVIQKIAWTVPAGAVSHSSIFAIADSWDMGGGALEDSSPETANIRNDPVNTVITASQLSSLVKSDHNYAQRNLNILGAPSGSSIPLPIMLAWVQMDNPSDQTAPASLEIDATQLQGLESLALEVDDERIGEIKLGEQSSVTITDALKPGERKILRFYATLRDTKSEGVLFPLHLKFMVNGELVNGYSHVIRVVPLAETIFQVLDLMYGALRNVAVACQSEAAQQVADNVLQILARERIRRSPGCLGLFWRIFRSTNAWKAEVTALDRGILSAAKSLEGRSEPEWQILHQRLRNLAELLLTSKSTTSHLFIEQIRDAVDHISQPAIQFLHRQK